MSCVKVREVAIILYEKADMAGGAPAQKGVRESNTGKYGALSLSTSHHRSMWGERPRKSEVLFYGWLVTDLEMGAESQKNSVVCIILN